MLMPKKVKFRKMQKGNMNGKAYSGADVSFGEFGLKAIEPGWVSSQQIEVGQDRDYPSRQEGLQGMDKDFPG